MNIARKTILATILSTSALLGVAVPSAAADTSGSVTATDGGARASYSYTSYTGRTTGTLRDLKAGDAKCARLYSQGYNFVRGWGGWNLEKTVCAGGSASYSHTPMVYSDKIDLIVCTGYSNCARVRVKG